MNKQYFILLLISIFLVACNSSSIKKKVANLDDAITDYNVSLRWSMLNKIESYHKNRDGEKQRMDRSTMEKIRITGYNILEQTLNEDATEAVVKGEVDFYSTDTGTLKKHSFTHIWWYDPELKRWFNESGYLELK